jgi:uncharacterized tellurite resistance protein B-like protein
MTTTSRIPTDQSETPDFTGEIRDTLNRLDELNRETAGYLKTLAFILHRVAMADNDVCDAEIDRMEQILVDHASLSRTEAMLTVEIAKHCGQIADCGCSYEASRQFRPNLDEDAAGRMYHFLESVAAADGGVHRSESAQIRQIAAELGLPS